MFFQGTSDIGYFESSEYQQSKTVTINLGYKPSIVSITHFGNYSSGGTMDSFLAGIHLYYNSAISTTKWSYMWGYYQGTAGGCSCPALGSDYNNITFNITNMGFTVIFNTIPIYVPGTYYYVAVK